MMCHERGARAALACYQVECILIASTVSACGRVVLTFCTMPKRHGACEFSKVDFVPKTQARGKKRMAS